MSKVYVIKYVLDLLFIQLRSLNVFLNVRTTCMFFCAFGGGSVKDMTSTY